MANNENVPSRNEWLFDVSDNDMIINNKCKIIKIYVKRFYAFINKMFEYDGLPDTIPQEYLELMIQKYGNVTIAKYNDKLYAFNGKLGGIYNEYMLPTISVVANAYLKMSETYKIGEDCEIIRNDVLYQGLDDRIRKYAEILAEIDITIKYSLYNARIPFIASADDDNTKESFDDFYKKIIDGKEYGIPMQRPLADALGKSLDIQQTQHVNNNIKDLMEIRQYYLASFFNELGLNANYNMKREAINENESAMNDDILIPDIQSMLECRQIDIDKVNKMFGTNISVKLSSVWKLKEEIIDAKLDNVDDIVDDGNEGDINDGETSEDTTN